MHDITRLIINAHIDEDIEQFLTSSSNGSKIDLNKVYFAHTIFINERNVMDSEDYAILIDSGIRIAHNRFFVDIIKKEGLGILGGWTGFAMTPNTGRCVDSFEPFSNVLLKKEGVLEELKEYVDEKNKELSYTKSK